MSDQEKADTTRVKAGRTRASGLQDQAGLAGSPPRPSRGAPNGPAARRGGSTGCAPRARISQLSVGAKPRPTSRILMLQSAKSGLKVWEPRGFRADQMSRQYFVHNQADPAKMTDLPPAVREGAAKEMLPTLVTEASRQIADAGETIKEPLASL